MNILKNYGLSIIVYTLSIIVLICIVSLIFAYSNINDRYIETGIFASLAISAFLSSVVLCRKIKKKGIIHGILINSICMVALYIISCILNNSVTFSNTFLIYLAISILSGIVGGILGVNI